MTGTVKRAASQASLKTRSSICSAVLLERFQKLCNTCPELEHQRASYSALKESLSYALIWKNVVSTVPVLQAWSARKACSQRTPGDALNVPGVAAR
jgi:hypothetical protein